MRRVAYALAGALVLTPPPSVAATERAAPGRVAPAFVLQRPAGGELDSRSFRHRPLLINVFAAWCGNCRIEQPLLGAAYAKYHTSVAFLGVDEQEGVARAVAFARELHVAYPIAVDDGQFAASYGTSKIPETVFVDAHGIVRAIYRGVVTRAALERELSKLVARKETT